MSNLDQSDIKLITEGSEANIDNLLLETDLDLDDSQQDQVISDVYAKKTYQQSDLCCFACLSKFDDKSHAPRRLKTCGHTFCQKCISDALKLAIDCARNGSQDNIMLTPKGFLKCPKCQMIVTPMIVKANELEYDHEILDHLGINEQQIQNLEEQKEDNIYNQVSVVETRDNLLQKFSENMHKRQTSIPKTGKKFQPKSVTRLSKSIVKRNFLSPDMQAAKGALPDSFHTQEK